MIGVALPAICLVSELPPPPGGMAVQAKLLGESLRRQGHVVLNAPTNALAHDSPWRRVKGVRGVLNMALYLARLAPACLKADCVHVFSSSYLGFFLFTMPAVVVGRALRKRVVIHFHGGAAREFLGRWGWLALPTFRAAHHVVVPSGFLGQMFREFGIAALEVPNILELGAFSFRPRVALRPRIMMSRHLAPVYNIGCGIRAFAAFRAHYPEATLMIAGGGSERSRMEALAAELGVAGAVTFAGDVANERMRALYDEHDIYLNTSRVDNQPVSILEALACGMPVVSTAVGGIPFMVAHGRDALLAPDDDAPALCELLLSLMRDPALAPRLAEAGRDRLRQYSWENVYRGHRVAYGAQDQP